MNSGYRRLVEQGLLLHACGHPKWLSYISWLGRLALCSKDSGHPTDDVKTPGAATSVIFRPTQS